MERDVMKMLLVAACALVLGMANAADKQTTWTEPATGMVFVSLPKTCFGMGSAKPVEPPFDSHWERIGWKDDLAADEVPRHEACVDAFWIGKMEVSEAEWHKVMGGDPPADGGKRAKVGVTWIQANEFAERLTARSGTGHRFRLPTEAEWEYACRAGSSKDVPPELEHLAGKAWYAQSAKRSYEVREVGALEANAFGLHDMLGNAWEWTQDSYLRDGYAKHALYNPKVDAPGEPRVIRGGSFRTELAQVRCAMRGRYDPALTLNAIGVRLVRH